MRPIAISMAVMAMVVLAIAGCSGSGDAESNSSGNDSRTSAGAGGVSEVLSMDKIKVGMSYSEVRGLLGEPNMKAGDDATAFTAMWTRGDGVHAVVFQDGKVSGFGGESARAADASRLAENFGKIKMGMTAQEVRSILGEPTSGGGSEDGGGLIWQTGDETYVVVFQHDKVVAIQRQ